MVSNLDINLTITFKFWKFAQPLWEFSSFYEKSTLFNFLFLQVKDGGLVVQREGEGKISKLSLKYQFPQTRSERGFKAI